MLGDNLPHRSSASRYTLSTSPSPSMLSTYSRQSATTELHDDDIFANSPTSPIPRYTHDELDGGDRDNNDDEHENSEDFGTVDRDVNGLASATDPGLSTSLVSMSYRSDTSAESLSSNSHLQYLDSSSHDLSVALEPSSSAYEQHTTSSSSHTVATYSTHPYPSFVMETYPGSIINLKVKYNGWLFSFMDSLVTTLILPSIAYILVHLNTYSSHECFTGGRRV
jgi:hypothetical protein